MILDVRDIYKSFGGVKALDGASLSLRSRTITSLFGANGSGKSTLFNVISGYLPADSGSIHLGDISLRGLAPLSIAKHGVGRIWQDPRVFKDLTVLDNLLMAVRPARKERLAVYLGLGGSTADHEARKKANVLLKEVGLEGHERDIAGSLSVGQQKLLSMAMLLMNDPRILLLDEPFAGVAPSMVKHIAEVLVALKEKGHAILLVEHNTSVARSISDQVLEMHDGQIAVNKALPK